MNFYWLLNFFSKVKNLIAIPNRIKFVLGICLALGLGSVFAKVVSRLKSKSKGPSPGIKPPSTHNPNNPEKSSSLSSSTTELIKYVVGKKVSCSTMGTIFQYNNYGSKIVIIETQLNSLLQLASLTDLYLITQYSSTSSPSSRPPSINGEKDNDDSFEKEILDLLESRKVFAAGLDRNKVLFCSTVMGKAHIARNLEPQLHIDSDSIVINALKTFVPYLALIHFHSTTSVDSDKINNAEISTPVSHDNIHVIQELHQLVNPI